MILKKGLIFTFGLGCMLTPTVEIFKNNLVSKNDNISELNNKINKDAIKEEPAIVNWNAFDVTSTSTGLTWRIVDNNAYLLNIYIQITNLEGQIYYEESNIKDLIGNTRIRGLEAKTKFNATIGVEYFDLISSQIKEVNQTFTFLTSDAPHYNFDYGYSQINEVRSTSFEMTIHSNENYDGIMYSRLVVMDQEGKALEYSLLNSEWSEPENQTNFDYYWKIRVFNLTPDTTYKIDLMFNTQFIFNVQTIHTEV